MKWYLASRTRHQTKLQELAAFLESKGQIINSDWIYKGSMKPFAEHLDEVQELGKHNVEMMLDTEVFMAINDKDGTDLFTEYGVCLAKKAQGGTIRLYIVGEYDHASLMQLYPGVIHVQTVAEVFDAENIDYTGFTIPSFI